MTGVIPPSESGEKGIHWHRGDWGEKASLQGWSALGLGCFAVAAGLVQMGFDGEFIPRLEVPLVAAMMGLPPIVLGLIAIDDSEKRPRSPFMLRHAGSLSLWFLAATFIAQLLWEGGR